MKPHVMTGVAAIASAALAGAISHFVTKKILAAQFEERLSTEIEQTKAFYAQVKKAEFKTPGEALDSVARAGKLGPSTKLLADAIQAITKYQGLEVQETSETIVEETTEILDNVFTQEQSENVGAETRDPSSPYVISSDEFMVNDRMHSQVTFTFYKKDGILSDERDEPIETNFINKTVGTYNLKNAVGSSDDPNTLYIRNESLQTDFEIALSDGSFAEEVLGFRGE